MRARRATQVDRQVGQSGQLGHNQHSRAPSSTSIVSPDTTPTSRSLGHRVISSFVRVPATRTHTHHYRERRAILRADLRNPSGSEIGLSVSECTELSSHSSRRMHSLVTYCSDRPATCTSARAVAHGRVHLQ